MLSIIKQKEGEKMLLVVSLLLSVQCVSVSISVRAQSYRLSHTPPPPASICCARLNFVLRIWRQVCLMCTIEGVELR
jgi:hypothetical protein